MMTRKFSKKLIIFCESMGHPIFFFIFLTRFSSLFMLVRLLTFLFKLCWFFQIENSQSTQWSKRGNVPVFAFIMWASFCIHICCGMYMMPPACPKCKRVFSLLPLIRENLLVSMTINWKTCMWNKLIPWVLLLMPYF